MSVPRVVLVRHGLHQSALAGDQAASLVGELRTATWSDDLVQAAEKLESALRYGHVAELQWDEALAMLTAIKWMLARAEGDRRLQELVDTLAASLR